MSPVPKHSGRDRIKRSPPKGAVGRDHLKHSEGGYEDKDEIVQGKWARHVLYPWGKARPSDWSSWSLCDFLEVQ